MDKGHKNNYKNPKKKNINFDLNEAPNENFNFGNIIVPNKTCAQKSKNKTKKGIIFVLA
jgi:hypothetical protein